MEKPCLNDPNEYPDDIVLSRTLGKTKAVWDTFHRYLEENCPSFTAEWRYYRDGKSWLYKLTKKQKTIAWISVYPGKFKTTFYFTDRAEESIKSSILNKALVDGFINGLHYGKIRGISVEITKTADLQDAKILIRIKEQQK